MEFKISKCSPSGDGGIDNFTKLVTRSNNNQNKMSLENARNFQNQKQENECNL